MNRVVLLLNLIVLVVTFALALTASNSQIGILETTNRAAAGFGRTRMSYTPSRDAPVAYLNVIQSLERALPADKANDLTVTQMRTIYDAVEKYYSAVGDGVWALLAVNDASKMTQASAAVGKAARVDVERVLMSAFPNSSDVTRLATEVIRHCR